MASAHMRSLRIRVLGHSPRTDALAAEGAWTAVWGGGDEWGDSALPLLPPHCSTDVLWVRLPV